MEDNEDAYSFDTVIRQIICPVIAPDELRRRRIIRSDSSLVLKQLMTRKTT
jgi:hypothetical protein